MVVKTSLVFIFIFDQYLFKKVVPHHCLGYIWSQRDKKENKHLAPTVQATITQFNLVTKCVISTILKDLQLKPQQRAKIIDKWIHIAQVWHCLSISMQKAKSHKDVEGSMQAIWVGC